MSDNIGVGWEGPPANPIPMYEHELIKFFLESKYLVDMYALQEKAHLIMELNNEKQLTISVLTNDCLQYVATFLLEKEIIEGPEPPIITSRTFRLIKNGRNVIITTQEWEAFKIYVRSKPNWTTFDWLPGEEPYNRFARVDLSYYILYDSNHDETD